ncbi:MAG TPA: 5'-nucleotidase C-terminal domain-containing protein [Pyrinomonadaceae bacterium]
MRRGDIRSHGMRAFLLVLLAAIYAPPAVFAQAQAIEPCPATPAPKIGSTVPAKVDVKTSQTIIDATIPNDAAVEKIIGSYAEKVRELSVVIGTLEGELKKSGVGASSLGNFVTDAMIMQARAKGKPAVLAITNAGGLRKNTIMPGPLRASDIFELLPFENALVEVDLTGAQLVKLLTNVTRGRDAQSGARIEFRWNQEDRPEFISAKLPGKDGTEMNIDPQATYTVVTIDYLMKLASGNYAILQEGTNVTPLNITIRDAVMDFVKAETKSGRPVRALLDNRFVQVGPGPKGSETSPND